jgi:hypothetical protein
MVVDPVDEGDLNLRPPQGPGGEQAAEPGADDDHPV